MILISSDPLIDVLNQKFIRCQNDICSEDIEDVPIVRSEECSVMNFENTIYIYKPDECNKRTKQADCCFINNVSSRNGEGKCVRFIELKSKSLDDICDVVQKFENSISQLIDVINGVTQLHYENPTLLIHPDFDPIDLLKDQIMNTRSSILINDVEYPIHIQYYQKPFSDITFVSELDRI
ncbi:MAG: hypothetical protein OEZ01_13870 [Candidatus Heimdallarchaeota archaeon]|nr:hypothetical protein [Candidatus Heimdallarchaeota archaeon]